MKPDQDGKSRVVIRLDVSGPTGIGHLRRCAVLAQRLKAAGLGVHLLVKATNFTPSTELRAVIDVFDSIDPDLPGPTDAARTAEYCHSVGASRAVIDHFHADEAYQQVLLDAGLRWLQFDGAATWPLWADWVVSMSPAADAAHYLALRRRERSKMLIGPRYAILRDEFLRWRGLRKPVPEARHLLLGFGGGDDRGACLLCLEALKLAGIEFTADVAVGGLNPRQHDIGAWINKHGAGEIKLHVDTSHMAELMARCDLAIIAGGMTSFEAAALGTPAIIVQIADNQRRNAEAWQAMGVAVNLGNFEDLNAKIVASRIAAVARDSALRLSLAKAGLEAVDCRGAGRIVAAFDEMPG